MASATRSRVRSLPWARCSCARLRRPRFPHQRAQHAGRQHVTTSHVHLHPSLYLPAARQPRYNPRHVITDLPVFARPFRARDRPVARLAGEHGVSGAVARAGPADAPSSAGVVALYSAYSVYSAILVLWSFWGDTTGSWPFVTHAVDIVIFSTFQYLTQGPSRPSSSSSCSRCSAAVCVGVARHTQHRCARHLRGRGYYRRFRGAVVRVGVRAQYVRDRARLSGGRHGPARSPWTL